MVNKRSIGTIEDFKKSNRRIKTLYEPYEDKLSIRANNEISLIDTMAIEYDKILYLHKLDTFEDNYLYSIDFNLPYV